MFRNFIKITWRNMIKGKMYATIKIGGFALGIAIFLLIAFFVKNELSVDQHFENRELIYRVLYKSTDPADSWRGSAFPAPIASVLGEEFPNIEMVGRLIAFDGWYNAGGNLFRRADEVTNVFEERFVYADPDFVKMLQLPMVYGDRAEALAKPGSILISKRKADKYFPDQNPIGKMVIINDDESKPFTIGGVIDNLQNTHLANFDFFITLSEVEFWKGEQTDWCCWNYSAYIKVRAGTDPGVLEENLLSIRDNQIIGHLRERGDQRIENIRKYHSLELQPLNEIYLNSQDVDLHNYLAQGDERIVWFVCCYWDSYITTGMYKFHQSFNGKICQSGQGSWFKKGSWITSSKPGPAISDGISHL